MRLKSGMQIGTAEETAKVEYLEETFSSDGEIQYEKKIAVLRDPGFDVTDTAALEEWARRRAGNVSTEHWMVWVREDNNTAAVTIFRP